MRFMKRLLLFVLLYLGIFGIACLAIFCVRGAEPQYLITAVFGSAGVELIISGAIKILEKKSDKEKERGNTDE